jgi:hypothetical protein
MSMYRVFIAFSLATALAGMASAQGAEPQEMPFLARQILQGQPSRQEAGPPMPPEQTLEQDVDASRAEIERQRRQARESRDEARSRADESWTGVMGR